MPLHNVVGLVDAVVVVSYRCCYFDLFCDMSKEQGHNMAVAPTPYHLSTHQRNCLATCNDCQPLFYPSMMGGGFVETIDGNIRSNAAVTGMDLGTYREYMVASRNNGICRDCKFRPGRSLLWPKPKPMKKPEPKYYAERRFVSGHRKSKRR